MVGEGLMDIPKVLEQLTLSSIMTDIIQCKTYESVESEVFHLVFYFEMENFGVELDSFVDKLECWAFVDKLECWVLVDKIGTSLVE
jgi:hypothetical protein